jgi:predicted nucleic acid-binding protein
MPDPDVLEWGLGKGETAVLTLARARAAVAILDDAEARAAARAFGIRVMGTLGVVLLARRDGRIASASQVLRALRRAGLHLDEALLRDALPRTVGETWEP